MHASSYLPQPSLPTDLDPERLPHHIAVILDGNGRWAKNRGLPRVWGHRQGGIALRDLVQVGQEWGIKILTVFVFSTENWHRPAEEVNFLMALFEEGLHKELDNLKQAGVRLGFIGELSELPMTLQGFIAEAVAATQHNDRLRFNIAVNYGGRREILRAVQQLAEAMHRGEIKQEQLTEVVFGRYLYTQGLPDPDLLIRTSGESRLSNFLLWQLAYTELYSTETLWPDFDRRSLHRALLNYQGRQRRFGTLKHAHSQP